METIDTGCAVGCRSANHHSHVNRSAPAAPFRISLESLTVIAHKLIILLLTVQLTTGNISPHLSGTHNQKYSLTYQVALNSIQPKGWKISTTHADFHR